jgi:RNA recognition motif-containing protein
MASKLYVGGLSFSTTSESLREYFGQCGTVVSATVITDRLSGQSRGFGFVEMSTDAEARTAVQTLDGQPFEGRKLKVDMAKAEASRAGGFRTAGGFGGGQRRPVRW